MTASTNRAGLQLATSGVNSTTTTSLAPCLAEQFLAAASELSSGGVWSGRTTDIGCGQKVTTTSGAPGSGAWPCAAARVAAVDAVEVPITTTGRSAAGASSTTPRSVPAHAEQTEVVAEKKKDRTGAADLGLDLTGGARGQDRGDNASLFRWLVACLLFGAPVDQDRAAAAFAELDRDGVLTPRQAGRRLPEKHLVQLLDAGRYTRYDDSKAAGQTAKARPRRRRALRRPAVAAARRCPDEEGGTSSSGVHGDRAGRGRHLPARRPRPAGTPDR